MPIVLVSISLLHPTPASAPAPALPLPIKLPAPALTGTFNTPPYEQHGMDRQVEKARCRVGSKLSGRCRSGLRPDGVSWPGPGGHSRPNTEYGRRILYSGGAGFRRVWITREDEHTKRQRYSTPAIHDPNQGLRQVTWMIRGPGTTSRRGAK
eukprot:768805-Hanusia_phi.AAC.15